MIPTPWRSILTAVILLLFAVAMAVAEEPTPVFDIPRLSGITIDGDPADWGAQGYRVEMMVPPAQNLGSNWEMKPSEDFDPAFRLGWTAEGLLFTAQVRDSAVVAGEKIDELWAYDALEIYVAAAPGSWEFYQMAMAPGIAADVPARKFFYDHRKSKATLPALTAQVASRRTADGYILEALLPWANLGSAPKAGDRIGIQLLLDDKDDAALPFPQSWSRMAWFPRANTYMDPTAMHAFRLAETPGLPVMAVVHHLFSPTTGSRVEVVAPRAASGKRITVCAGEKTLLNTMLANGDDGRAVAALPSPSNGEPYQNLTVQIDGQPVAALQCVDDPITVLTGISDALRFEPAIFSGEQFPTCALKNPAQIAKLLGPYTLNVRYFDSNYRQVLTAKTPGRYGAIVEVKLPQAGMTVQHARYLGVVDITRSESGRTFRYFRTLYRTPQPVTWPDTLDAQSVLPAECGINPQVAREQWAKLVDKKTLTVPHEPQLPAMLAALYATKPGAALYTKATDAMAQDRQWWVGLKRKLYGTDREFARPIVCPRPLAGPPATVVHEGTADQAGMKLGATQQIDAVLQQWAADTEEAFAVCIVRHGVIVLHKAYGTRDGKPMTVNTPSWMASMTKLLGGVTMLTAMDQTGIKLDDRADKYLPALRHVPVAKPLTLRQLYTHTAGMSGHWGDDVNDFEEAIAIIYPQLKVAKYYEYGGTDLALCGKVIEAVSGEALPQYYMKHLLAPLGCTRTTVTNASFDGNSVPLDLAKVGQLLLNKGAYGNQRFFSPDTFQQFLPTPLRQTVGIDSDEEYGMGSGWYRNDGLSPQTFGHGAASGMTFRVDPVNDLVIVMTRNSHGRNFDTYYPQFMQAIVAGMDHSSQNASGE